MNVFHAIWPWKHMGNRGETGGKGWKCTEAEASLWEILLLVRGEMCFRGVHGSE